MININNIGRFLFEVVGLRYVKLPSPMMLTCGGGLAYWLSSIIHVSFVAISIMILLYIPLLSFIGLYAEQRKYLIQNKKVNKSDKADSKDANQQQAVAQDQPLAIEANKSNVPRLTNESGKH